MERRNENIYKWTHVKEIWRNVNEIRMKTEDKKKIYKKYVCIRENLRIGNKRKRALKVGKSSIKRMKKWTNVLENLRNVNQSKIESRKK